MRILGVNAYHADSSAAIIEDGKLIGAVEEERFNRVKHWSGFPEESIRFCLKQADVSLGEIDHIAINRDTKANFHKKVMYVLTQRPSFKQIYHRFKNKKKMENIAGLFSDNFSVDKDKILKKINYVEHHRAHLASSFFVSPFKEAALLSVDGFGDFASCMFGVGKGNKIEVLDSVFYPHSLGVFYTAVTQFLGFLRYGDEYKVMGLAPYGKAVYIKEMEKLVLLQDNGKFTLDLRFFQHHTKGDNMSWNNCAPDMGVLYSEQMKDLFGEPRSKGEELTQKHMDIAASLQVMYEKALFHMLKALHETGGSSNLCLAGGCAMNSVANGKVFDNTPFKDIYIQSAAGDAGGAIGAAFYVYNHIKDQKRIFVMEHAYLGPDYSDESIKSIIEENDQRIKEKGCSVEHVQEDGNSTGMIAELLADGHVVGFFQGKMEWGPRALGHRSILCDPRRTDAKSLLNSKIKMRESFRPFAPSILREHVSDWFEKEYDVPFMLQVYNVKEQMRSVIPSVTHINGTGRLQTVTKQNNGIYYDLIKAFYEKTKVPILLNTSFNENEPIVCTPLEALNCFLRTKMDVLVLGKFIVKRDRN